jgi:hypothetical protein
LRKFPKSSGRNATWPCLCSGLQKKMLFKKKWSWSELRSLSFARVPVCWRILSKIQYTRPTYFWDCHKHQVSLSWPRCGFNPRCWIWSSQNGSTTAGAIGDPEPRLHGNCWAGITEYLSQVT